MRNTQRTVLLVWRYHILLYRKHLDNKNLVQADMQVPVKLPTDPQV